MNNYKMRSRSNTLILIPAADVSDIDLSSNSEDSSSDEFQPKKIAKNVFTSATSSDTISSSDEIGFTGYAVTSKSKKATGKAKGKAKSKKSPKSKPSEVWSSGTLPNISSRFKSNPPIYELFHSEFELPIDYFRFFLKDEMIAHLADHAELSWPDS